MQRLLAGKAKNLMHTVLFLCQQNYCKNSATVEPRSSWVEPCQEDSFESNSVESLCRYCIPLWNYASEHQLISILHRLPSKNHFRTAVSQSLLWYIAPSLPSSPNTKPEPLYHQCCCFSNPGLSGPSCASVPLPMPDSKQRCAKYVVKSSEILWNSHTHKKSQRLLPHSSHTSAHTHISCGLRWNETNKLKFTQICMMDLAHLSTNPLCRLPFTHFTISPSTSSVWIHIALPPPLMTDSSASSPNSKPEPLQGQCCCHTNPGLSGSSSASVPLPMPDSRQRCGKYVVKSSKMLWNSHARNLNAFYRMLLILPLILTYHVVSDEMKRTTSNALRSAWWTRRQSSVYSSFHSFHHFTFD